MAKDVITKLERIKEILREAGKAQINLGSEAAISNIARKINNVNSMKINNVKPYKYDED